MKLHYLGAALACAALISGCGSKSAEKAAEAEKAEAAALTEKFGPASSQEFHDAAYFDLYGDVKSCKIEDTADHSVTELNFGPDGKLIPAKELSVRYTFEYDSEGYPVALPTGTFTWERGRLAKASGESEAAFSYNEEGVMTDMTTPKVNYSYRVTETDPTGNWTKRHVKTMTLDKDGNVAEVTDSFQRRTIEYYNN